MAHSETIVPGCHSCFIILDSNQDKDKSATEETTNQDDVYSQIKKFQVCNTFFVDSTSAHIAQRFIILFCRLAWFYLKGLFIYAFHGYRSFRYIKLIPSRCK